MPDDKRHRRSDVNVLFYNAVGGVEFNDEICKVFTVKAFIFRVEPRKRIADSASHFLEVFDAAPNVRVSVGLVVMVV